MKNEAACLYCQKTFPKHHIEWHGGVQSHNKAITKWNRLTGKEWVIESCQIDETMCVAIGQEEERLTCIQCGQTVTQDSPEVHRTKCKNWQYSKFCPSRSYRPFHINENTGQPPWKHTPAPTSAPGMSQPSTSTAPPPPPPPVEPKDHTAPWARTPTRVRPYIAKAA